MLCVIIYPTNPERKKIFDVFATKEAKVKKEYPTKKLSHSTDNIIAVRYNLSHKSRKGKIFDVPATKEAKLKKAYPYQKLF